MLVARVVHHEVEDHAQAPRVRLPDEPVEVVLRAEEGIDRGMIADVVPDIKPRAREDRRQPDAVDAQPIRPKVIEVLDDPRQVADAVPIRVAVAARIDLVDDPLAPPLRPVAGEGRRGRRDVGHRR